MISKEPALIEPTATLKSGFLEMAEEFHLDGDNRYEMARNDFGAYLDRVKQFSEGCNLPLDRVRSDEFWLISEGRIIGRSGIRHWLTPSLENEGGNIGYDIRPSERLKGYGTLILKLMLEKARQLDMDRVLITCDADNIGSAKIIENNGGVLSGTGVSEKTGKQILQYWIEL